MDQERTKTSYELSRKPGSRLWIWSHNLRVSAFLRHRDVPDDADWSAYRLQNRQLRTIGLRELLRSRRRELRLPSFRSSDLPPPLIWIHFWWHETAPPQRLTQARLRSRTNAGNDEPWGLPIFHSASSWGRLLHTSRTAAYSKHRQMIENLYAEFGHHPSYRECDMMAAWLFWVLLARSAGYNVRSAHQTNTSSP